MFPGMNPKQMQQAMKQLGIKQEEIDAIEVIIRLHDKEIVVSNPSIQKIKMQGQESFQISGNVSERSLDTAAEITNEDIETVMAQANCTRDEAIDAINEADGDLAEAVLMLTDE